MLLILFAATTGGLEARAQSAKETVEQFTNALSKVMQNAQTLRFSGRYETLSPVIRRNFNLSGMARYAAGRHWRGLDSEGQAKLVDAFTRLWITTYAGRFNDYSGESFEVGSAEPKRRKTMLVRTNIVKNNGEKVALDYLLRQKKSAWRVIDIFLKGKYSELAKQRSEYVSILKREGLSGLLRKVDLKIERIKNDGA